MVRIIERRLRKLEAETASRRRRTFIFGEVKPGEAKMQELLAGGVAHKDDLFIFTGVPQSDPSRYAVWDGDLFCELGLPSVHSSRCFMVVPPAETS